MKQEETALIEAARQMARDITDNEVQREQRRKLREEERKKREGVQEEGRLAKERQAQAYKEAVMGRVAKLLGENRREDAIRLLGAWESGNNICYYDRYHWYKEHPLHIPGEVYNYSWNEIALRPDFFDDQAQALLNRLQNEKEEDREKLQKIQALYDDGNYSAILGNYSEVLEQEPLFNSYAASQKAQEIREQAKEEKNKLNVLRAILIYVVGPIVILIIICIAGYLAGVR